MRLVDKSKLDDFADKFDIVNSAKPVVVLRAGQLDRTIDAIAKALVSEGAEIYDRGGGMCLITHSTESSESKGVSRPAGMPQIKMMSPERFQVEICQYINYKKHSDAKNISVPATPTIGVAKSAISAVDRGGYHKLRGVIRTPALMPDGRLIVAPGYNTESQLYLDIDTSWLTYASDEPTHDEAVSAVAKIETLYRYFPTKSGADLSVMLALNITSLMRPLLDTAPGFVLTAPSAGTGKTLLADACSVLSNGLPAAVFDYGRDPVEGDKRLDGLQLSGDTLIVLDNFEGHTIGGAVLCQMLTQTSRNIRPLGSHDIVTVSCAATIIITGNNVVMSGDITRRVVECRLDAEDEHPEQRDIKQNLLAEIAERRHELVMALLSIVRAYILAGRPKQGLVPLGSFEQWSNTVRSALVWAGAADPCETMTRTRKADPARQATAAIFKVWHAKFGDSGTTSAIAIKAAAQDPELHAALETVCMRGSHLNSRALGMWLRGKKDCRVGGFLLFRVEGGANAARWAVKSGV